MKILLLILIDFLFSLHIHVPGDYKVIQEAISNSTDGDTIYVSSGIYYENITFEGKDIALIGEDRVNTIIDGSSVGNISNSNNSHLGSVVRFENGETSLALLKSFTIQNGIGTIFLSHRRGGGILITNSSTATLSDLHIKNNSAEFGGGIYCYPKAKDFVIDGPFISDVIISFNRSEKQGGGLSLQRCNCNATNVLVHDNYSVRGGGLNIQNINNVTLSNITVVNNSAFLKETSGIYMLGWTHYNQTVDIYNSIIWDNISLNPDYSEQRKSKLYLSINYSDVYKMKPSKYINKGVGVIKKKPKFNSDFTIQSNSPCIDAGNPYSPLDPDGSIINMGTYYFE